MKEFRIKTLIFALLLPLITGALSAAISSKGMSMYAIMDKPPLSPPAWVFPVVWTILYLMMGIASYPILVSDSSEKYMALVFYAMQLIMNFSWSILFFSWEMYLFAFIWLIIMWVVVIICTRFFFQINKLSGWLMVPYILWLTFAAYLNMGVFVLARR